jgi:hypothetical protein
MSAFFWTTARNIMIALVKAWSPVDFWHLSMMYLPANKIE